MSYRIVILNGEKRGERLDIGQSPLTIGRSSSCLMQLSDPTVAEIHATISPHAKGLSIQVLDKTHDLRINKASVQESLLKHGDVIEIGTTRLFVQSQQTPGAWESLTQLRKWRKWMTVVLPVLFIAIIAAIIHSCRPEASAPKSDSAPLHTPLYTRPDTNNTDWVVTNVPQILIDPSVILTTSPTEIMDAKETLMAARTNNIQEEIDASRTELEFASHFLTEARKQNSDAQPPSDATLSKTILQQAEESLGITTAAPAPIVRTNMLSNLATNETVTHQTGDLKN